MAFTNPHLCFFCRVHKASPKSNLIIHMYKPYSQTGRQKHDYSTIRVSVPRCHICARGQNLQYSNLFKAGFISLATLVIVFFLVGFLAVRVVGYSHPNLYCVAGAIGILVGILVMFVAMFVLSKGTLHVDPYHGRNAEDYPVVVERKGEGWVMGIPPGHVLRN